MTTAYDVPAGQLVEALTRKLRETDSVKATDWTEFAKTGRHREKAPIEADWWHRRVASVLRKVYIMGPVGTSRLAAEFGGAADRGSKPNKAVKGSGSATRMALQQLEKAGLVQQQKSRGRVISGKGRSFVDDAAHEVFQSVVKVEPGLEKYGTKDKSEKK